MLIVNMAEDRYVTDAERYPVVPQFDLQRLPSMSLRQRRRYLARFRKENRQWYAAFKKSVVERAGVTPGMVSRVLHNPRYSKPVWAAAVAVYRELEQQRIAAENAE